MKTLSLIAVIPLFLVGCAKMPTKVTPPPFETKAPQNATEKSPQEQKHSEVAQLKTWQAKGRMAIQHKDKGTNVSYVWQQYPHNYQIRLFGPFGSGSVYITGYPNYVELKESNGKITRASTPEGLLSKATGLNLPITGLNHWLRGLPVPKQPIQSQRVDNRGTLQHLAQQGWFIRYDNYNFEQSTPLPSKMQLQNKDVKVKLVVTEWQI